MPGIGLPARSGVGAALPDSPGRSPRAAVAVSAARAEASRRNGARSRGPRTPEGKARSARNALRHGLRAARHLVVPAEDSAAFAALEKALLAELAPDGALQEALALQVVSAIWRLARADRIEAEILIFRDRREGDLGVAVTRDANTARALPTLVRYRGAAQAEFLRALRTLRALQAEAAKAAAAAPDEPAPRRAAGCLRRRPRPPLSEPRAARAIPHRGAAPGMPNEPEPRGATPAAPAAPSPAPDGATRARPNEPEPGGNPGRAAPAAPTEAAAGAAHGRTRSVLQEIRREAGAPPGPVLAAPPGSRAAGPLRRVPQGS